MAGSKNVVAVDDASFDKEVLASDKTVLVDFGATWCGPCKALAPIVEKIADDTVGTLKVATVDIDDSPEVARKYGIRGVPTVLVFRAGKVVGTQVGLASREKLLALLAE